MKEVEIPEITPWEIRMTRAPWIVGGHVYDVEMQIFRFSLFGAQDVCVNPDRVIALDADRIKLGIEHKGTLPFVADVEIRLKPQVSRLKSKRIRRKVQINTSGVEIKTIADISAFTCADRSQHVPGASLACWLWSNFEYRSSLVASSISVALNKLSFGLLQINPFDFLRALAGRMGHVRLESVAVEASNVDFRILSNEREPELIERLIERQVKRNNDFVTHLMQEIFQGGLQFYTDQFKQFFLSRCETPGSQKVALLGAFGAGVALGSGTHIVAAALHAVSVAPVIYHLEGRAAGLTGEQLKPQRELRDKASSHWHESLVPR